MNQKIKTAAALPEPSTQTFRTFVLRVVLLWMFIVFVYWMFTSHLPSQVVFTETTKRKLPEIFSALEPERFLTYRRFFEVFFSVSLLILVFIPKSKTALFIHLASAIFFALSASVVRGNTPVPLTAYVLLLFSFLMRRDKVFFNSFDFMLTILIVLILLYASNYFVQWYNYFHGMFFNTMVKTRSEDYTLRDKMLTAVMPWFYCAFLVFIVRIFTTRFNRVLLIICVVLLAFEFYLNNFFDPGLTFMFFPLINWRRMFERFNTRFEPK